MTDDPEKGIKIPDAMMKKLLGISRWQKWAIIMVLAEALGDRRLMDIIHVLWKDEEDNNGRNKVSNDTPG